MKKNEVFKIFESNTFANAFSALAFLVALLTLIQGQWQIHNQNQDKIIFTTDSAYNEEVFLVEEDDSYFFSVPNRVILTNRSERNHPLQDLLFFVNGDWRCLSR